MSDIGSLIVEMRGLLDGPFDEVARTRLRNGFDRLVERLEVVERVAQEALVEQHKRRLEKAQVTMRAAYDLLREADSAWPTVVAAERLLELELARGRT